ncbi:MAG: hypothetical protein IJ013_00430 [Bacteroidaceae bacterium]|nr:hypothetical protein [Bacteroidaceae bacterium]
MKKEELTLLFFVIFCFHTFAQKSDTLRAKESLSQTDSVYIEYMESFVSQLKSPRYKLYPTTNMWTFLKLNTATGQIWQVQYSMDDNKRFEYVLDTKWRLSEWDEYICGRFELYPTQNRNTFILLDNINGRCWQVQWNIDDDSRFVLPID